jgi:hypothetical protein
MTSTPTSDVAAEQVSVRETFDTLIFEPGDAEGDHNAFIHGFAYGRFTELDSEMALHWFRRGESAATCSIVPELRNLLRQPSLDSKEAVEADTIAELRKALKAAQVVIDYAAERLWNGRPDAVQRRPAHVDAALRLVARTTLDTANNLSTDGEA